MPNKLFGIADPQYDALRVLSNQAVEAGASDSSFPPAGGGLLNKIYVWHADGSTIDLFDPTQAGLIAALAAAAADDTVWLPSISISITTGVTVPADVTVIGISDNAEISAASFSGTAITLSAGSSLFGFSVTFVSNGTTAIGIDARAANARIEHLTITVSGGSTSNIRILAGSNTAQQIVEVWSIVGSNVVWAECDGTNTPLVWNTIAAPAAFGAFLVNYGVAVQVDHLGHYAYIQGSDTGNGNRTTVWQLTNLAAIRANPATSPSWSVIAYNTQVVSVGTLTVGFLGLFHMRAFGDTLYFHGGPATAGGDILGKYNGSSWAWTSQTGNGTAYQPVTGEAYAQIDLASGPSYIRAWDTGAIIDTFTFFFGIDHTSELWRRFDSIARISFPRPGSGSHVYIRETATGSEYDLGTVNSADGTTVRGALTSDKVYVVSDGDGKLHYSSDGLSYNIIATWAQGWVMNQYTDGHGNLLWLKYSQSDNNPVLRLYDSGGSLLGDITGDLWTAIGHPGGTLIFGNLALVYEEGVIAAGNLPLIADIHAGSAEGTGAIDISIAGGAFVLDTHIETINVAASGIVYLRDVAYETSSGTGTIEPIQADRGVWDALGYQVRHANDIDAAAGIHHTTLYLSSMFVANELANGSIFVGGSDNIPHQRAMSGDASISNTGVVTLTTVNPDVGTFGDDTHIAQITVDAKGRITAIGEILFAHAGEHIELAVSGLIPGDPILTPDGSDFIYGYVAD